MEIKSKKVVYECPIFKIEERQVITPSNAEKTFWVMIRPPNTGVVALTKDKKIILIKEILGEDNKECLLIPGGKVDTYNYAEEDVKKQALLELREEAGYTAKNTQLISKISAPWNTIDRDFYHYAAWDLEDVGQNLEDGESINRYLVTLEEAEKIIKERKMTSPEEERILEKAIKFFKEKGLLP